MPAMTASARVEPEDSAAMPGVHAYAQPHNDPAAVAALRECLYQAGIEEAFERIVGEKPTFILTDKALTELEMLTTSTRLAVLSYAAQYLCITPELMAEKYFNRFPDDAKVIEALFNDCRGRPQTQRELELLVVSYPYLEQQQAIIAPDLRRRFNAGLELSQRRSAAAKKIMGETPVDLAAFGQAGLEVMEVIDDAHIVLGDHSHVVNVGAMFGEPFAALDSDARSKLLKLALEDLHYYTVAQDCYRSAITHDDVMEANLLSREGKPAPWVFAHSTVYGFEHSSQIFGADLRSLIQPMLEPVSLKTPGRTRLVDRYPLQRMMLEVISRIGSQQETSPIARANCDGLLAFWDKSRNPVFCGALAEALTQLDPQYAAAQLLERIRSTSGYRNHLAALLYRIELGKLNISVDGVRYLERMYDLQDYNRPDYFVRRLTAQGEVGIFDGRSRLVKYFALGDLTDSKTAVQPEVLEFTLQTLFHGNVSDSPDLVAARQRWLEEFKRSYASTYLDEFYEKTGVHFNDLSFKEQGGYVHFIDGADMAEQERALNLVRKFGESGLRSFASLQFDEKLKSGIFLIAEALPTDLASEIFQRYSLVVETAGEAEGFCRDHFSPEQRVTSGMLDEISYDLLKGAKAFLAETISAIEQRRTKDLKQLCESLCELLETTHEQVALFSSCYREIAKHSALTYQNVKECRLESIAASSLAAEDKARFLRLAQDRATTTYDPDYAGLVIGELRRALNLESNTFHFIRFGNHVLGFCRSELQHNTGAIYLGSLNSHKQIAGTRIGMSLLKDVADELTREHDLIAYVGPGRDALVGFYEAQHGFKRAGTLPDGTVVIRRTKA